MGETIDLDAEDIDIDILGTLPPGDQSPPLVVLSPSASPVLLPKREDSVSQPPDDFDLDEDPALGLGSHPSANANGLYKGQFFGTLKDFHLACLAAGRRQHRNFQGFSSFAVGHDRGTSKIVYACSDLGRPTARNLDDICAWQIAAEGNVDEEGELSDIVITQLSNADIDGFLAHSSHEHLARHDEISIVGMIFDSREAVVDFVAERFPVSYNREGIATAVYLWCPNRCDSQIVAAPVGDGEWMISNANLEHSRKCRAIQRGDSVSESSESESSQTESESDGESEAEEHDEWTEHQASRPKRHRRASTSSADDEIQVASSRASSRSVSPNLPPGELELDSGDELEVSISPPNADGKVTIGQVFATRKDFDAACRTYGRRYSAQNGRFDGVSMIYESRGPMVDILDFLCTGGVVRRDAPGSHGQCSWRIRAEMHYNKARSIRYVKVVEMFPYAKFAPQHSSHPPNCHDEHGDHPHLGKSFDTLDAARDFVSAVLQVKAWKWSTPPTYVCRGRHQDNGGTCELEYRLEQNCFQQWIVWRLRPDHSAFCSFGPGTPTATNSPGSSHRDDATSVSSDHSGGESDKKSMHRKAPLTLRRVKMVSSPSVMSAAGPSELSVGQIFSTRRDFDAACRAFGRSQPGQANFDGITMIHGKENDYDLLEFRCSGHGNIARARSGRSKRCSWRVRAKLAYNDDRSEARIEILHLPSIKGVAVGHDCPSGRQMGPALLHADLWARFPDTGAAKAFVRRRAGCDQVYSPHALTTGQRLLTIACSKQAPGDGARRYKHCSWRFQFELNRFGEWVVWNVCDEHSHEEGCDEASSEADESGEDGVSSEVAPWSPASSAKPLEKVSNVSMSSPRAMFSHTKRSLSPRSVYPSAKRTRVLDGSLVSGDKPTSRSSVDVASAAGARNPVQRLCTYLENIWKSPDLVPLAQHLADAGVTHLNLVSLTRIELQDILQYDLHAHLRQSATWLLDAIVRELDMADKPEEHDGKQVSNILRAKSLARVLAALHPGLQSDAVEDWCTMAGMDFALLADPPESLGEHVWAATESRFAGNLSLLDRVLLRRRLEVWQESVKELA